jgi:hypothetical protein
MNSVEPLLSDPRKARSQRGPDLANKENELMGVGNSDPKTEQPFWQNEI